MNSSAKAQGMLAEDRYRSLPENRAVEIMMLLGWPFEVSGGKSEQTARAALQLWVEKGLQFRIGPQGERLFDPVEIGNFPKRLSATQGDGSFSRLFLQTNQRLVADLEASIPASGERTFVVDMKRTFNLKSIRAGAPLRLRAPLPLEGEDLTDVKVEAFGKAPAEFRLRVTPGRLELRTVAAGDQDVTLGATVRFTCHAKRTPVVKGECPNSALYLSFHEGMIVVSGRIQVLSAQLAPAELAPMEAVRSFWEFIKSKLSNCTIHYDQIDPAAPCDWALETGEVDCQLSACLFIALCRARGLPARLLGGNLLHQQVPTKHYWVEVWISGQGWTPFDFLSVGSTDGLRERFFGRLEYRMTCERYPREFTGALGVPLPKVWCLLQAPRDGGAEITLAHLDGIPIYQDTIRIRE